MQTVPVKPADRMGRMDQQLAIAALQPGPHTRNPPIPLPMVAPPAPEMAAPHSSAATSAAEANPFAELDAMLIRDPNVGAIHGLRTALLFNAGLALSGLVIWEIWSLLAL